eukprot:719974-Amphidinium_carterae.1
MKTSKKSTPPSNMCKNTSENLVLSPAKIVQKESVEFKDIQVHTHRTLNVRSANLSKNSATQQYDGEGHLEVWKPSVILHPLTDHCMGDSN